MLYDCTMCNISHFLLPSHYTILCLQHLMLRIDQLSIHHIPFLRVLLPLVVGIVWQHSQASNIALCACIVVAIASGCVALKLRSNTLSTTFRAAFSLFIFTTLTSVGMALYAATSAHAIMPNVSDKAVAIARIEELPIERDYSYRTQATIVAIDDSNTLKATEIPVILYLAKSFTASDLRGGDLILFTPQLHTITSSTLPHAFDYASYMARRGIIYEQHLRDEEWQLSSYMHTSLRNRAKNLQSDCVSSLYKSGLSHEHASLLAALLWGYKANIPDNVRQYFSASGLSHVLAVSGLHIGIIAGLLWFLLYPLRLFSFRRLQGVVTMLLLWVYAFVTGLSPSVVRACIMATFVGIALLLNRRNTSLNALCGSAFIVLFAAPMQLFEIGFQLSYAAVAGILLFTPLLDTLRRNASNNKIVQYIFGSLSLSFSAQVATLPIAAHYFRYIPLWGWISNLLLLPLLPIIMLAALLLQLCIAMGLPHTWLTSLTNTLTNLFVTAAQFIATWPGAAIQDIAITWPMLTLYIIAIFTLWYAISRRTLQPTLLILLAIIGIQGMALYETLRPTTPIAFVTSEQRHCQLQLADASQQCLIASTDSIQNTPRNGTEWRTREHLTAHLLTQGDTISTPHTYAALPFIHYYDRMILWVDNNTWRYIHSQTPLTIDHAIITEQYNGTIAQLLRTFDIKHIVLSETIYPEKVQLLAAECIKLQLPYHDIETDGAWMMQP